MVRTIVLGVFAALGAFWTWYFYDQTTEHDRALQVRDATIDELRGSLESKDEELRAQAERIDQQNEEIQLLGQQIQRLEISIHLLKVDHRVARLEVLDQAPDPDDPSRTRTTVRFVELDPDGNEIGEGVVVTVEGRKVYIEGLTIKFEDEFVELGDYLRGTSVCLFTRIFGENEAPSAGHELDPKSTHPLPYSGDELPDPFYDELWSRFWDYANDPEEAAAMGVRAAHGEAPFVEARPGKVYKVELRQSGGLTVTPEN